MRPASSSSYDNLGSSSSSSSSCWGTGHMGDFRSLKSPIPYLFGGLALMLALIAVALLILACSYRKRQSSTSFAHSGGDEEKSPATKTTADSEPKFLVIMAGDTNPTYLANPISSTTHHAQQSV